MIEDAVVLQGAQGLGAGASSVLCFDENVAYISAIYDPDDPRPVNTYCPLVWFAKTSTNATVTNGDNAILRSLRVIQVAIKSHNPRVDSFTYPAGTVIQPNTAPDPDVVYVSLNFGTTAAVAPAFPDAPGTVNDGTIVWEYRGLFDDTSFWEPVVASLPTMLTVDVAAGGTITLSADEAAHDRIKLIGNLAAAVTLVVEPGAAVGWVKSFLNATDDAFTISVQATTGGGALAATIPPQGGTPKAKLLFADDTNVYEYA
mgnify:FL=1